MTGSVEPDPQIRDLENPTRLALLDAAQTAFAARSYDGVTISQIARAAGVVQPAAYYHFGSKEKLWRAVLDRAMQNYQAAYIAALEDFSATTPLEQFEALIRAMVRASAAMPQIPRLVISAVNDVPERADWLIDTHLMTLHHVFEDVFDKALDQGLIVDRPKSLTALIILGAVSHFYGYGRVLDRHYQIDNTDPAAIADFEDMLVATVMTGLKGP